MFQLARHGAKVYLLARSKQRAQAAIERITSLDATLSKQIVFVQCDLADLESVKAAAEEFTKREKKLHILLNNAGVMALPYGLTKQGLEMQNGTNVVGHMVLSFLLLPTLTATARSLPQGARSVRIVQISSVGHVVPPLMLQNQRWTSLEAVNRAWKPEVVGTWIRYGMSKTGNVLLASALEKLTQNNGVRIANLSVHPGAVNTELQESVKSRMPMRGLIDRIAATLLVTPQQGSLTQLYAATSPEIDEKKLSGSYLVPTAQVGWKVGDAKDHDGARSAELYTFVRDFVKEKVQVDLDQLVREAGLTQI